MYKLQSLSKSFDKLNLVVLSRLNTKINFSSTPLSVQDGSSPLWMDSQLNLFCPRCPASTRPYSLDELREHVAKDHLEMTPLFTCPHCQMGFISPQIALYHFRFVCCLQQHFLTTSFTKNLLSMDISFFYQLYLIETEAIRNLQSAGSPSSPVPSLLVEDEHEPLVFHAEDQNEVNRFLKKLRAEIEEKVIKSSPKELQIELRDSDARNTPIIPLTSQHSNPEEYGPAEPPREPSDCPISPKKSAKRAVESYSGQTCPKKEKKEEKKETPSRELPRCYMDSLDQIRRTDRKQGSREWKKQYGRRAVADHACEYERCCDSYCREICSFCNGLHRSQNCAAIIDFEDRKMILRSKGLCTRCGVKHSSKDECSKMEMCKYCPSIKHLSVFCSSIKYQRRQDQLKSQEKYPPSIEILQFRAERTAIYRKGRLMEELHRAKDEKMEVKPSLSSAPQNSP